MCSVLRLCTSVLVLAPAASAMQQKRGRGGGSRLSSAGQQELGCKKLAGSQQLGRGWA